MRLDETISKDSFIIHEFVDWSRNCLAATDPNPIRYNAFVSSLKGTTAAATTTTNRNRLERS